MGKMEAEERIMGEVNELLQEIESHDNDVIDIAPFFFTSGK